MLLAHELIERNGRRDPDGWAWSFGDRKTTWSAAAERIARLSENLVHLGLRSGDRLGLFSENTDRLAELYYALARAGIIAVPLNPRSVRAEIAYVLEDVGARGIVVSATLRAKLFGTGAPPPVEFLIGTGLDHGCPIDLDDLYGAAPAIVPARDENAIRAIKYTSGTTGRPKGCISTHRQHIGNLQDYLVQMHFADDERCLLSLPMTAGVGIAMLTAYVYRGVPTVIHDRFDADFFLDEIERSGITRFYCVPTMISALVAAQKSRPRDLSSLRYLGYGGSPAAFTLIAEGMDVLGCAFYQTFGASESGGFITYLKPEDHRKLVALGDGVTAENGLVVMPCGREVQNYEVRLVGDDGRDVAPGDVGEIWIRSDSNMSGYWNRPEQTAEVLRDGWLVSGDLGVRDGFGYLSIVDRKRDMILAGGYNVYSSEIESVLQTHGAVAEVAVVGVPDEYYGERVVAFVVTHAQRACDVDELKRLAETQLASYKRPSAFYFLDELPKTNTGKIQKPALRVRARELTLAIP